MAPLPQKKIDFHSHILPKVDDGSRSCEMSSQMFARLRAQAVGTVVLTPHYYSGREPLSAFLQRRDAAFAHLLDSGAAQGISLRLGAEVYLTEYLLNNRDLTPLCIDGTRTMLVELPEGTRAIGERLSSLLGQLSTDHLITPVIAHIERYPRLCRSRRTLEWLMESGALLQSNLGAFAGFGKGMLCRLVKQGYIRVLGTDAHDLRLRPADYDTGYAYLSAHVPQETLENMTSTMEDLLQNT